MSKENTLEVIQSDANTALTQFTTPAAQASTIDIVVRINRSLGFISDFAHRMKAIVSEDLYLLYKACDSKDELFLEFCHEAGLQMRPPIALKQAKVWSIARQNKDLRELAHQKPKETLKLMNQLISAGVDKLDENEDAEVVEFFSMAVKHRNKAIKEWVAAKKNTCEAKPEAIKTLEAERDQAIARADELEQENLALALSKQLANFDAVKSNLQIHYQELTIFAEKALRLATTDKKQREECATLLDSLQEAAEQIQLVANNSVQLCSDIQAMGGVKTSDSIDKKNWDVVSTEADIEEVDTV